MPDADLEPLLRYWRAQDDLFERVELAWWGAVVSDPRFPRVHEGNYARIETRQPVRLDEVRALARPALDRAGSPTEHVVLFFPEDQTDLLAEASMEGRKLTWDLVMEAHTPRPAHAQGHTSAADPSPVDEIERFDKAFWRDYRESARHFDINEEDVLEQMAAIERRVMIPAGRRWFAVRESRSRVALASLLVLEGVGYLDHVLTFPAARRRGYATALVRRILAETFASGAETFASGAERLYLLADPDGAAVGLYERLGFTRVCQTASWLGPT